MSEISEINTEEREIPQSLSHRRILILTAICVVVGSVLSFLYAEARFAIGFLIGGILSIVNYYWLKVSLKTVFERINNGGDKPRFLAGRYILRYGFLGLVLTIVYLTKTVPVTSVLMGLISFAFAIFLEGLIRLFTALFNKKGI